MTSQNIWNMSLFEHFFKGLSLYLEARIRIRIRVNASASNKNQNLDPHQGDKSNPNPHQSDEDPQHCKKGLLFLLLSNIVLEGLERKVVFQQRKLNLHPYILFGFLKGLLAKSIL
jgi:hypothetical protein